MVPPFFSEAPFSKMAGFLAVDVHCSEEDGLALGVKAFESSEVKDDDEGSFPSLQDLVQFLIGISVGSKSSKLENLECIRQMWYTWKLYQYFHLPHWLWLLAATTG